MVAARGELYERLADLSLEIEGYEVERRELPVSSGFTRVTTTITLHGGGSTGCGEDVSYVAEDHEPYPDALPLAGRWTFDGFSRHLEDQVFFPQPPRMASAREYRRWAFESAALDLALRQAGMSLGAALRRPYRRLRFVVSTRLDIRPWLALNPDLEFKLDPTSEWEPEFVREIAATGRVRVVDFKGYYEGTPVDQEPDFGLYRMVTQAFPDAIVEDAVVTPATYELLWDVKERLSWDAVIHSVADIEGLPYPPQYLNVKPSRFGTVRALLECLEYAAARGITLYGGGQFELGVGREHIQALASLFYADGPNDVAPRGYNAPEARAGLPASPLAPPDDPRGLSFS